MNKKWRVWISLFIMVFLLIGCQSKEAASQVSQQKKELQESTDLTDFVQVENNKFVINHEPFRFMGTNNYYMNYKNNEMIDDVIVNAKELGVKVIRVWGFLDGMGNSMIDNNAYMQTKPGVFDEIPEGAINGFEALDYTIKRASEEGIYLVIALTNNWDAFGGVNQYIAWSESATKHDDFFTDESTKDMYKNYVTYVINRKNTYTGRLYKEESAIMTWELMNEPRCESDPTCVTVYNWAKEMSEYIKNIDSNHLVALGDEGFFNRSEETGWAYNGYSGIDWEKNLTIPTIDYGTIHLYPEHWGDGFENPLKSGNKWISDHKIAGEKIGKPVVLEEYGIQKGIIHNRDYIYQQWLDTSFKSSIDGTMFWLLTGIDTGESADENGLYPDYDGFRVVNDGGKTSQILHEHSLQMRGELESFSIKSFILKPRTGEKVSGIYAFKVDTVIGDNKSELLGYTMEIEGISEEIEMPKSGVLVIDTTDFNVTGDTIVKITGSLKDGSKISDEVRVVFDNNQKVEVIKNSYSFEDGLQGFAGEGSYQADFDTNKIEHNKAFNGGALQINAKLTGDKEWQELRIVNRNVGNMGDYIRVEFDVYYDKELAIGVGEFKPYAVANPGWLKLGVDVNNQMLVDLEIIEMNNKNFYKQHVIIPVSGIFNAPELFIGIVGGMINYEGPIYIDDILLIGEEIAKT